jgi:hypothetical protein
MKKPDKEGFKFLALCCTLTGFIYNFIPDGLLNKEKNKILKAVEYLLSTLPRRCSLKYLLGLDNYFTQPVVVAMTRGLNFGLVGTARRRRSWPPQEYKQIVDWRYNSLYEMPREKDDQQYMLMRWIDNGVVDMVSTTIHTGRETIVKKRRKPRETSTNYRHITTVFGNEWEKMIAIPGYIDDYNNHTMNGVNKAYQLITYYRPQIRCRRTWMPMFFHCLDICQVNSSIIAKAKGVCDSQKDYTLDWIQALNRRAQFMDLQSSTRRATVDLYLPTKKLPKELECLVLILNYLLIDFKEIRNTMFLT